MNVHANLSLADAERNSKSIIYFEKMQQVKDDSNNVESKNIIREIERKRVKENEEKMEPLRSSRHDTNSKKFFKDSRETSEQHI